MGNRADLNLGAGCNGVVGFAVGFGNFVGFGSVGIGYTGQEGCTGLGCAGFGSGFGSGSGFETDFGFGCGIGFGSGNFASFFGGVVHMLGLNSGFGCFGSDFAGFFLPS